MKILLPSLYSPNPQASRWQKTRLLDSIFPLQTLQSQRCQTSCSRQGVRDTESVSHEVECWYYSDGLGKSAVILINLRKQLLKIQLSLSLSPNLYSCIVEAFSSDPVEVVAVQD